MKRFSFLSLMPLLCFLTSSLVFAQKLPMKFGKIDPAYFALKSYDKDTSAAALILGDYGESRISYDQNEGFILEYTRHFRARIFTKAGYSLANQSLILYQQGNDKERLTTLRGIVYNLENGRVTESNLEKSMIFDEQIDSRHLLKKFVLPNVREGSILEFTYQVRSNFLFEIPSWQFQNTVPALWSEYRISYPEYFQYKKLQKGYLTLDENEETDKPVTITIRESKDYTDIGDHSQPQSWQFHYLDHTFRWVKNDVPAFRQEPYMNALINYLTGIQFELAAYNPPSGMTRNFTQTWEKINEELLKDDDFGMQLKKSGFLKDIVENVQAASKDPSMQMQMAYDFVKNTMKWNELNRMYANQNIRNVFDKKSGSSAEINLMLVALLKELGLDSEPVIISTRSNGMINPAQIMLSQFNYVIASVKIGDNTYLLDATDKTCPYNLLPDRCINGQGRVISETRSGWIDLNTAQKYELTNVINGTLSSDGTISGDLSRKFLNYAALDQRTMVEEEKSEDDYIHDLENKIKGLTVNKYQLENLDSLSKPYVEKFNVKIDDATQHAGGLITFAPVLLDQWNENPLKMENREFPVDFIYPRTYKDIVTIRIPDGYVLDEKPEDMAIGLPDGVTRYIFKISALNNQIQIFSQLNLGKSMYTFDEYKALQEFFNKMVSKQAEKIVLKKVS